MISYDHIMTILRMLSVAGNSVATTYLHLLYNCNPDERQRIILQIETFARSFTYEVGRIGPTEFKSEQPATATMTPVVKWD